VHVIAIEAYDYINFFLGGLASSKMLMICGFN